MSKYSKYIFTIFLFLAHSLNTQEKPYLKTLFENSSMPEAYYFSKVDFSGNSWIKNVDGKLPVNDSVFFTPKNALLIEYQSSNEGYWSAEILYDDIRGINHFVSAEILSFWLFLSNKEAISSLPKVNLKLAEKKYTQSISLNEICQELPVNQWVQIKIPLAEFGQSIAVDEIKGLSLSQDKTGQSNQSFLIDQIEFLPEQSSGVVTKAPKLIDAKGYEKHIDLSWEKINDALIRYVQIYRKGNNESDFKYIGLQSPWISGYTDFVGESKDTFTYKLSFLSQDYQKTSFSNSLSTKTRKLTDEELLDMIQESHLRYYWEGAEPNSGLALENIPGRTSMIATGASGFGMMAIIAGINRDFISREDAVERFLKSTRYLLMANRFHGVFPHFLNGQTGKVVPFFGNKDNGADLVETSFLMQGLLTARSFFDQDNLKEQEIRNNITKLWKEVEWNWFRQKSSPDFLTWHWSPDQSWVIDHQLIGWNETMITYCLAIASPTHSVPASMYYSGWASQSEKARDYRINWGKTNDGSNYSNGNSYYNIELPIGVSNGGPLFFTHYSFFGMNPHEITDIYGNYFDNNQRIALINQKYCINNPENHQGYGEDFWGLTASDGPGRYLADEPNPNNDRGKMTPTGALSSFPYTPEASMKALKNYYTNHGKELYGYYGFYDAISLDEHWRSPIYMGLNQAPIVVMLENYRSGLIWDLFMSNKDVQIGLKKLNNETYKRKKP